MLKQSTLIVIVSTVLLWGSDLEKSPLSSMSLEELMGIEVSTGSFLELDLYRSPVSLTTITSEQIELSGARNLSEVLEIYVPGFQYMINKWNGIIWGMRGIASDRNNKFLFLINGKKQNLQAYHGVATEYTLGLMGDIEKIEVLRGPAGLIYGSGALAGVVNIVTKHSFENSSYGSVTFETTGKNALMGLRLEGGLYATLKDYHSFALHGGFRYSNGLGDNAVKNFGAYELFELPTIESGHNTAGTAGATPGNFLGSFNHTAGNFNSYIRYTHQRDDMAAYYYPAPWAEIPDSNNQITWIKDEVYIWDVTHNYHFYWKPHLKSYIRDNVSINLSYDWYFAEDKLTLEGNYARATNRSVNKEFNGTPEMVAVTSGETRYEIGLNYLLKRFEKFQLASGVEFGLDHIGEDLEGRNEVWYWSDVNQRMEMKEYITDIKYYKAAFYSEAEVKLNDLFALNLGLRFDSHTRTKAQFSPKAAVVYTPNSNHSFKLIAQSSSNNADALTYELAPGISEKGWSYDIAQPYGPDADSLGLDSLKRLMGDLTAPVSQEELYNIVPEHSYSIEIATNHLLGSKVHLGSSLSYNMIRDLFSWNDALGRIENLGEYDALVIELDAGVNLNRHTFGGNVAFQKPIGFNNNPSTFTMPNFVPAWDTTKGEWVPSDTLPDGSYVGDTTISQDIMASQISGDGDYFNNLHTVTTKLFWDFKPFDYLTFHADARIFWGLWGRSSIHESITNDENVDWETNFLNMANEQGYIHDGYEPMTKLNLSLHFHLPRNIDVGIFAYDLFGENDNIHSVRWHQMATRYQSEYYTVDQRAFALKIRKSF